MKKQERLMNWIDYNYSKSAIRRIQKCLNIGRAQAYKYYRGDSRLTLDQTELLCEEFEVKMYLNVQQKIEGI